MPARSRPAIRRPGPAPACRSRRSSGWRCTTGRWSSGRTSTARCGLGAWRCCATAPRRATRINKARMVRLAEYSRDCLRALRADTGIAYDERMRARCSCSAPRSSSTAAPSDIAVLRAERRRLRAARPRRLHPPRAGAGAGAATSSSAACSCPATRPATASSSPSALAELAAERGVDVPLRHARSAASTRSGDRIAGVATDAGTLDRRCLRRRARQLLAAAARADRPAHPGLSGQGLLDHRADHRRRPARPSRP